MPKNFSAWPKGWPKSLNYPETPVHAILDQTTARVPDRTVILFEGREFSYARLQNLSLRFTAALTALGIKKGDRVAFHLPNCPQFAIAYYGVMRSGAVFTPLSPLLSPREAANQLNDSGAETLIALREQIPRLEPVIPQTGLKRIITTNIDDNLDQGDGSGQMGRIQGLDVFDIAALLSEYPPSPPDVAIDPREDLAHLAYTGGTTGVSKGVMLTHYSVIANTMQVAHWIIGADFSFENGVFKIFYPEGVDPARDRLLVVDREMSLVVSPWYHALGTIRYLNNQIYLGATMVVMDHFNPKEFLEAVVKYRITVLGGAPQVYIPLVNHPDFESYDLSGVKFAASGAAPLALPLLKRLLEAFSGVVCEAYGLTECTMGASANPPDRQAIRQGSIGLPTFDTEFKMIDLETGEDLPVGSEGEVCFRGPQVMKGYWNKPDETADTLRDGWLLTGDIGREDEDGYFYITGRKKDMIIYKGYNVYPREIEEVIFEHPAVQQCAVVGKPDPDGGEIPVAFVELKQDARVSKEEIMEFTNPKIAYYKKIRDVIFVDAIPVSGPGKVLKKDLRDRLR